MGGGTGSDDSSKLEKLVSDLKTFAIGTRDELKEKPNELYLFLHTIETVSIPLFAFCIAKKDYQKALYFAPLFIDDAVRIYNYLRYLKHPDKPSHTPGLIGTIRGYLKKKKEEKPIQDS